MSTDPEESRGTFTSDETGHGEPCLSDLYALLQTSISTLEQSPHQSIDTLTLLMEQVCAQQEVLQSTSAYQERLEFWRQVNETWLYVIDSAMKTKVLERGDWRAVCETVVAVGNVLSLYGMVDYPMGFAEARIVQAICRGLADISN
ncbi:hypothetical protein HDV06_000118 [Boothiomyces sp. JEL0866]|nr:hypothetical protein HDV06_000118 [Boothiomyces sp. JEL0866]